VIVDVGTGDGRAVLARAAADPSILSIGIDAVAAAMTRSWRRARRRRLENARFFVEAAERLPGPLAGCASLVTVTFPWGSLLRGVLGLGPDILGGIRGLLRPDGRLEILLSVTPRDRVDGVAAFDAGAKASVASAARAAGLDLLSARSATPEDLGANHSSWARRLGDRPVWRLDLARAATPAERDSGQIQVPG